MTKNLIIKNLLTKSFVVLLCVAFCISCQTDKDALQNDATAKAEINRVNQIVARGLEISPEDFESVKKIYGEYPTSETARKLYQNLLTKRGDWTSLEKFFNEIPASEISVDDKLTLAKVYIKIGRYEDSLKILEAMKDQNAIEVRSLLANAYFHLGKYVEAKSLIDDSWDQIIKEKRIDDIFLRGMIYFYEKENEKAIETLEKVLEIDPDSGPAANGLSRVYAAQGDTEKAEKYMAKVQEIFARSTAEEKRKTNLTDKLYKLQAAYKAKRFQEVIELANQILPEANPQNKAVLYQYLYNSYQALGKQKEAQEVLAKAKQMQQR